MEDFEELEEMYKKAIKSPQFLASDSHEEKIAFILTQICPVKTFRANLFEKCDNYRREHNKDLQKTRDFMAQGRDLFGDQNYHSAFESFTYAIVSAPDPSNAESLSRELSLAYASRSAVSFQCEDYSLALFDANKSIDLCETFEMLLHRVYCLRHLDRIQESVDAMDQILAKIEAKTLAIDRKSVQRLDAIKQTLIRKLEKSSQKLKSDEDTDEENTDSSDDQTTAHTSKEKPNSGPDLWLHPNCEIRQTKEKGRHMCAKELIPKGTVLIVERPYSGLVMDSQLVYCANCYTKIGTRFTPCMACDEVVFCDDHCMAEANQGFHRFECGIAGHIYESSPSSHHTFRIISRFGFKNTIDYLKQNSEDIDIMPYVERRQKLSSTQNSPFESSEEEELNRFEAFMSLSDHHNKHELPEDIFHYIRAINTALLFDYSLQIDFDVERQLDSFVSLVVICLRLIRKVNTNVFGWVSSPDWTTVGSGINPIGSLVNHSCNPNAHWGFTNRYFVVTATEDIEAGQEIHHTYGPTIRTQPFIARQQRLKKHYFFNCGCDSCLRESREYMAIRCNGCDGPVVFTYAFKKQNHCCLKCGQEYRNFSQTMAKVESSKCMFSQMALNVDNNHNTFLSIVICEKTLNILLQYVCPQSQPLMDCIRQLVRIYLGIKRFDKAIAYSHHFEPIFGEQELDLEDLYLMANCYYMYLTDKRFPKTAQDSDHWAAAFGFYRRLIWSLKSHKKWLTNDGHIFDTPVVANIGDTEDVDSADATTWSKTWMKKVREQLKTVIQEVRALKRLRQSSK